MTARKRGKAKKSEGTGVSKATDVPPVTSVETTAEGEGRW